MPIIKGAEAARVLKAVSRLERQPINARVSLQPRRHVTAADAPGVYIGKAAADIAKETFGDVTVWLGVPGSEVETETVINCFNRSRDITAGEDVVVRYINGHPYVIAHCCSGPTCSICSDNYSESGTGGAGRPCPFTGGDELEVSGDKLELAEGTTVTFTDGPVDPTDSVSVTVVANPADNDNATLRVLLVDGGESIYGEAAIVDGDITIRVGNQDGVLQEREIGTGGLTGNATLQLCFYPRIPEGTEEFEFSLSPLDIAGDEGAPPTWFNVDNAKAPGGGFANIDSLGDDQVSPVISAFWRPFLPDDATIDSLTVNVIVREPAMPANAIEDVLAAATAGGVSLANKAGFTALPAPDFGDMTYVWSGGDLAGVTAVGINSGGVGFSFQGHMPLGTGGGTQIDVDYFELTINYTSPYGSPGRVTFHYDDGVGIECIGATGLTEEGDKFPALSAVASDWDIHSYAATKIDDGCVACDACLEPSNCVSLCCADTESLPQSLLLEGLLSGEEDEQCCLGLADAYEIGVQNGPGSGCSYGWLFNPPIIVGGEPCDNYFFGVAASINQDVNDDCFWEATVACFDPNGEKGFTAVYSYQIPDEDSCDEFPITLSRVSFNETGSVGFTPPTTLTLDIP